MTEVIDFLKPRFVGPRFDGHALPLEILKDLVALDELITETAKWLYLQENQNRKRIPKGFFEGISLKLADVEDGSVIPKIVLVVASATTGLFPSVNQGYFEKARDHVIAAVDAAEHQNNISEHLNEDLLAYFERLGRGLDEGEYIEFTPTNLEKPSRLSRDSRRSLILASEKAQNYTEEVSLRGLVPEADQEKRTFTLLLSNDQRIPVHFESTNEDKVLEAFGAYPSGQKIAVKGIGRYSRSRKLLELPSLDYIIMLDPLDVPIRLEEFSKLQDGWLDGEGKAFAQSELLWFSKTFESNYDTQLTLPRLYPTAEGGIQAEWASENVEISLEVNLLTKKAEYQSLDVINNTSREISIDLSQEEGWKELNETLKQIKGLTQ